MSTRHGLATRAIHADRALNPTRAVAPAIFQTSTFQWDSPDAGLKFGEAEEPPAEFYSRWGNPNGRQLEAIVASLEGGEGALAVSSGMAAACLAVTPFVQAGDHVVGAKTLYGEVNALLTRILPRFGVESSLVRSGDPDEYRCALRPNTRVIVTESPANPTMECIDLAAVAALARHHGARLVVDNTFATPVNTRPLDHGAHASFNSATKYLGGHADVTAGVLVSDRESVRRAWDHLRVFGAVIDPFAAWLVIRGLRTFPLRMERHNANGLKVAQFLAAHPKVTRVNYPGLPAHPSHEVAKRQMRGFGGMISLELAGGEAAALHFTKSLRLFTLAASLGGVESLCMFPASLSKMSPDQRRAAGISAGLIRLSVGCEDSEDLIDDLEQALSASPA